LIARLIAARLRVPTHSLEKIQDFPDPREKFFRTFSEPRNA